MGAGGSPPFPAGAKGSISPPPHPHVCAFRPPLLQYSLIKDVVSSLKRHRMHEQQFTHHPLLVLSNFGLQQIQVKLMASMFQNMFPSINVHRVSEGGVPTLLGRGAQCPSPLLRLVLLYPSTIWMKELNVSLATLLMPPNWEGPLTLS